VTVDKQKSHKKKVARLNEEFKQAKQEMSSTQFKSGFFLSFILLALIGVLNSRYLSKCMLVYFLVIVKAMMV
jgi:hypothetical protein